MKKTILHLFIVDPQNDFCVDDDGHGNRGTLVVLNAKDDMRRLARMVDRLQDKIDDIHVTLDSHQNIGIERPGWWVRANDGTHPTPFTCLGVHPDGKRVVKMEFINGAAVPTEEEYRTYIPTHMHKGGATQEGSLGYLKALAAKQRYPHIVWPIHCCVGTWGASVVPVVADALGRWERDQCARINYVAKGNNPWTEHFSGLQAEVPDPADPATQINTHLIRTLEEADIVLVTGEALSHCVANTFRDVAAAFSKPEYVEKLVLLEDTTSNVTGFDFLGSGFVKDMKAKGMKVENSETYLA